jgi:hypothetical protein
VEEEWEVEMEEQYRDYGDIRVQASIIFRKVEEEWEEEMEEQY